MTQVNDYDRYAAMRQEAFKKGLSLPHHFVEKPAMRKLLPNLDHKKVLMLGCGSGEESVLLEEFGATNMTGVDLSPESIRLAAQSYPHHTFRVADMHHLDFSDNSFDFVYSSLAIHYSSDPARVYAEMIRVLKPGGALQFSVGHPMRWASERLTIEGSRAKVMGYSEGHGDVRLYGSYSDFQECEETFASGETLRFWVGPPSMHFTLLKKAGFTVDEFVETRAIEDAKSVDANYYARFSHFPQFTIFVASKPI